MTGHNWLFQVPYNQWVCTICGARDQYAKVKPADDATVLVKVPGPSPAPFPGSSQEHDWVRVTCDEYQVWKVMAS